MNKKIISSVMLICLLAFSFMFLGCDPDNGEDSGGLTITGLDSINGKYVCAISDENSGSLLAFADLSNTTYEGKFALVSNGKAVLNVYNNDDSLSIFKGSRSNVLFTILENDRETESVVSGEMNDIPRTFTVIVNFNNGVAKGNAEPKN